MQINYQTPTAKKLAKAKAYLASTDWYYARKAETGEDVPAEVVTKRIAARDYIRAQES